LILEEVSFRRENKMMADEALMNGWRLRLSKPKTKR
jgi:hypothetical protein